MKAQIFADFEIMSFIFLHKSAFKSANNLSASGGSARTDYK